MSRPTMLTRKLLVTGPMVAAMLLVACGEDDSDVPVATTEAVTTTTEPATTTTATTVVLLEPGDPCGSYGVSQKAGELTLYCDGEVWGTEVPPSTTAAPEG